ncbi:unnamed protein product [Paramecium pentaurelia]|uniref:Uncharacterized protein n=1 Tax=Paramecium pentaurelia TaxID=43138 RepID=A0A8S1YQN1_9CILI|nr:unnamed protein product [Paramecium pentaurelia]
MPVVLVHSIFFKNIRGVQSLDQWLRSHYFINFNFKVNVEQMFTFSLIFFQHFFEIIQWKFFFFQRQHHNTKKPPSSPVQSQTEPATLQVCISSFITQVWRQKSCLQKEQLSSGVMNGYIYMDQFIFKNPEFIEREVRWKEQIEELEAKKIDLNKEEMNPLKVLKRSNFLQIRRIPWQFELWPITFPHTEVIGSERLRKFGLYSIYHLETLKKVQKRMTLQMSDVAKFIKKMINNDCEAYQPKAFQIPV